MISIPSIWNGPCTGSGSKGEVLIVPVPKAKTHCGQLLQCLAVSVNIPSYNHDCTSRLYTQLLEEWPALDLPCTLLINIRHHCTKSLRIKWVCPSFWKLLLSTRSLFESVSLRHRPAYQNTDQASTNCIKYYNSHLFLNSNGNQVQYMHAYIICNSIGYILNINIVSLWRIRYKYIVSWWRLLHMPAVITRLLWWHIHFKWTENHDIDFSTYWQMLMDIGGQCRVCSEGCILALTNSHGLSADPIDQM